MMKNACSGLLCSLLFLTASGTAPAASLCLEGPGATGYSFGSTTLGYDLISGASGRLTSDPVCAPGAPPLNINTAENNGDSADATANASVNGLYTGASTLSTNGPLVGTGRAASLSGLEIAFRINTLPGYSGTGIESLDYAFNIDGFGTGSASGPGGSYSGNYMVDVGVGVLNGLGTQLAFLTGDAVAGNFGSLFTGSTSIMTDTDYVFRITQNVQLVSTSSYDGFTFGSGFAESGITTTFGLNLPSFADGLELEFPMIAALGVGAPSVDGAVPSAVPLPAAACLMVSGLAVLGLPLVSRARAKSQTWLRSRA